MGLVKLMAGDNCGGGVSEGRAERAGKNIEGGHDYSAANR